MRLEDLQVVREVPSVRENFLIFAWLNSTITEKELKNPNQWKTPYTVYKNAICIRILTNVI
jgi:hypothetical protein